MPDYRGSEVVADVGFWARPVRLKPVRESLLVALSGDLLDTRRHLSV